ncbi:MAG: hypothetical protein ACXVPM_18550 [Bacteroidia bacterium]
MKILIKYYLLGLTICCLHSISLAQQIGADSITAEVPEKIYGKNKVLKPNEYYLHQMDLWKKEIDKNPKNADAWYNYYRANRNAYIKGEEGDSQKAKGITRFDRLKNIVDGMEKNVPNSFEYNFVKWANGNNDFSLFPFLEKAYQLSPNDPDVIMSLIFYYEIKGDYIQRNKHIQEYYNLGEYSPGLLNYSYNMLSGVEKNAIILTEGDKDTEAALLLQYGKGYRRDVQILNVNLVLIKEYRDHVFKELGIEELNFDPLLTDNNFEQFHKVIVEHISKNKNNRPVYVAVNVRDVYTAPVIKNLYITGLAYQYSTIHVDNIPLLKTNMEQNYAIDYLKVYFPHDISFGNVNSMNENYILPLSTLSNYYLLSGDKLKANQYKDLALKIATAADRQDLFKEYFKNNTDK